jgi:phospholipid/cholesterol/gamma-HCH transport system permease protein
MNTEISVMKVNNELYALETFQIDPVNYLYVPRVLTGVITLLFLSGIALVLIWASGLLTAILFFGVARDHELALITAAIDFADIGLMFFKAALFGFFITLIPIWFGLSATRQLTSIPVAVLNGMLKVFIAIIIIEVLTLTLRFI